MYNDTISLADPKAIDRQVIAGLYEEHSPGIYRYAYRLLGDQDLAEECVAETFSRFLQALHKGQGPDQNVQAYLYRVAHNWITDFYRRQPPTVDLDGDDPRDPAGDPCSAMDERQERERVRAALLKLPSDQRRVILLRLLEHWSHERVAETIGKSVEATRSLQSRGLAALRRMLVTEDGNDDETKPL